MRRAKRFRCLGRFTRDVIAHTPLVQMIALMVVLWLLFAAGLYFIESGAAAPGIRSYWDAVYWGVAAFSTSGITDKPVSGLGLLIG